MAGKGIAETPTDETEDGQPVSLDAVSPDRLTDRIREILGEESMRSFALRAGVKPSTLQGVVHGGNPTADTLVAIANAARVSIDWLLLGRGPRDPSAKAPSNTDYVGIPRYDVQLSAGGGAFTERAELLDYIPFTARFLRRKLGRSRVDGLVMVEAAGDSMEPTISDGDLVMVDTSIRSVGDGLYALVYDDALLVKRLQMHFDALEIVSDNSEVYRTVTLPKVRLPEIQIVGRVRWIARVV